MIKKIYALRDVKSHWLDPFVDENDDCAIRGVSLLVNNADPTVLIGFSPRDFDLYCLGSFDSLDGSVILEPNGLPRFVVNAGMIGDVSNED